jgi:hypothetical protein
MIDICIIDKWQKKRDSVEWLCKCVHMVLVQRALINVVNVWYNSIERTAASFPSTLELRK